MKIYFAASIRGGRDDRQIYEEMINYLAVKGNVLTEHIADKNLNEEGEKNMTDDEIHDRDMDWLLQADVIVAEVTTPSLGVGYEIGRAFDAGKKIVCLYRKQQGKRLSAMIAGNIQIENYEYETINEAKKIIDNIFKK